MILITIGEKKGSNFKVFANNVFIGSFNKKLIEKLKIENNKKYTIEYVKKIKLIGNFYSAQKKAMLLLQIKDYSEKELFLKLKKNYSEKISRLVVLKMKKLKYVDDFKYAENLAKKLIINKNKSKKLAILEILKKGISKSIAENVVENFNLNPKKQLESLIIKKYLKKLDTPSSTKKVIACLLRLGHSYFDIVSAISKIKSKKNIN